MARQATTTAPQEHDLVQLARPMPELGLMGNEAGTVVHVYAAGDLEVEFPLAAGKSIVTTLKRTDIRLLSSPS